MSPIRACTPADLPRVADLFQAIFRGSTSPAPASLAPYLQELFFQSPWHDPGLPSLVYTAPDGQVGGFIGVIPMPMTLQGRPVRAALSSSIMVERPKDNPLAGARLLKAFLGGPQELSFSDDSNAISAEMWRKLGAQEMPLESMEWLRVLRPAGFALSTIGERLPFAKLARPICTAVDRFATRGAGSRFRVKSLNVPRGHDVELDDRSLVEAMQRVADGYALGPAWDGESLGWLLHHAAQNRRRGELVAGVVHGRAESPLGCYLYWRRPHGVAHVLQVMCSPGAEGNVLDSLLGHALQKGCVAVRGRAHNRYIDALFSRDCIFFNRGSVLVHSANPDVMAAARSGDALLTGLAGEAWTRIAGGDVFA